MEYVTSVFENERTSKIYFQFSFPKRSTKLSLSRLRGETKIHTLWELFSKSRHGAMKKFLRYWIKRWMHSIVSLDPHERWSRKLLANCYPSVNASVMVQNRMSVVESLNELAIYLTYTLGDGEHREKCPSPTNDVRVTRNISRHTIRKKKGAAKLVRQPCKRCYEISSKQCRFDKRKIIAVTTYCNECTGKPHFCLRCFNIVHHISDEVSLWFLYDEPN